MARFGRSYPANLTGLNPRPESPDTTEWPIAVNLDATGYAPIVQATINIPVTPILGVAAITGNAPSIGVGQPKGTFGPIDVNAGFWPSRRYGSFASKGGAAIAITPARGSLGFISVASPLSQGIIIAPLMGSIIISGFAPVDIIATILAPSLGSAGFTGISSTLLVENIIRGPPVAALAATGIIPTVSRGTLISPLVGSLNAASQQPTAGQSYFITPSKGDIAVSSTVPVFFVGVGLVPGAGTVAFSGNLPNFKYELFLTPPAGLLTASAVASGLSRSITPQAGSLAGTGIVSTLIQGAVIVPTVGSGLVAPTTASLLLGSVGIPPQGSLGLSGFGPLIQLVTFVPAGSLAITGTNASVTSGTIQIQRTQLGSRFIPARRYKLQAFANKFGTQQSLIPAGALTLSGNAPTIIKSYVPALAAVTIAGYPPAINISTSGDRFVTPPVGSLLASGQLPNAIRGSTKKTQLGARFIPGRRYGNFGFKAGINIAITPSCGGGIRINYLVDGLGNYIVDGSGNYILSYDDQANTTAVLSGFLPQVQISVLAGINISPSRGSLTASSAAPTVKIETFITPIKRDLLATGNAPISSGGIVITPAAGSLSISTAAPNAGIAYILTPPRASLTAAGTLSTIFIGAGVGNIEAPNNANLSVIGYQPITKTAAITPLAQLSSSGFAPTVSRATVIVPPRAQIFALGQFPVPARSTVVVPPAGTLSTAGAASLQAIQAIVSAAQLGLSGYAPFVTTETGLRVTGASLSASGFAPAQITTWSAPAGQASFTGYSPQIPKLFIPAAGQLGVSSSPPLFKLPEVILIDLKGKAVGSLMLSGQLIGAADLLSGQAVNVVIIKGTGT